MRWQTYRAVDPASTVVVSDATFENAVMKCGRIDADDDGIENAIWLGAFDRYNLFELSTTQGSTNLGKCTIEHQPSLVVTDITALLLCAVGSNFEPTDLHRETATLNLMTRKLKLMYISLSQNAPKLKVWWKYPILFKIFGTHRQIDSRAARKYNTSSPTTIGGGIKNFWANSTQQWPVCPYFDPHSLL